MDNTLSLIELNEIAMEFGIVFEKAGRNAVFMPHMEYSLETHGAALADKCEERGSRWCEVIRASMSNGLLLWLIVDPFTLTP